MLVMAVTMELVTLLASNNDPCVPKLREILTEGEPLAAPD